MRQRFIYFSLYLFPHCLCRFLLFLFTLLSRILPMRLVVDLLAFSLPRPIRKLHAELFNEAVLPQAYILAGVFEGRCNIQHYTEHPPGYS